VNASSDLGLYMKTVFSLLHLLFYIQFQLTLGLLIRFDLTFALSGPHSCNINKIAIAYSYVK